MLADVRDPNMRVFVVWEPVLITDWHAPGAAALDRLPDARVSQFWDRGRTLSKAIRPGRVVWDWIAIFPPGVEWTDAFPAPAFSGAPVVRVIDDFRKRLVR